MYGEIAFCCFLYFSWLTSRFGFSENRRRAFKNVSTFWFRYAVDLLRASCRLSELWLVARLCWLCIEEREGWEIVEDQIDCRVSWETLAWGSVPRCSMYGIFTYIYSKNGPNVGKCFIHGASGVGLAETNGKKNRFGQVYLARIMGMKHKANINQHDPWTKRMQKRRGSSLCQIRRICKMPNFLMVNWLFWDANLMKIVHTNGHVSTPWWLYSRHFRR